MAHNHTSRGLRLRFRHVFILATAVGAAAVALVRHRKLTESERAFKAHYGPD